MRSNTDKVPANILGFERQHRVDRVEVDLAQTRQPVQRSLVGAHAESLEELRGAGTLEPADTGYGLAEFVRDVVAAGIGPFLTKH